MTETYEPTRQEAIILVALHLAQKANKGEAVSFEKILEHAAEIINTNPHFAHLQ